MYYMIILSLCVFVLGQDIEKETYNKGDTCIDNEESLGFCTPLQDCKQALLDMKNKKPIKKCGTQSSPTLVCCSTYTFEALSRIENLDTCKFQYEQRCEKTPRKSHDACEQYQEMICPKPKELPEDREGPSGTFTAEAFEPIISYGNNSKEGQFPYLALLGFGNDSSTASWQCGGSIISERFILTAGHCTGSPSLLITFDELVKPACLYAASEEAKDEVTIAGWGATSYQGEVADVLQYASLNKFSDEECSKLYQRSRLLKQGFNSTTQLCYGHYERPKDTCPGDSGGPLETINFRFPCLRTVIGVTSFGKQCGHTRVPAVYTRVEAYLPWIESIVWP